MFFRCPNIYAHKGAQYNICYRFCRLAFLVLWLIFEPYLNNRGYIRKEAPQHAVFSVKML